MTLKSVGVKGRLVTFFAGALPLSMAVACSGSHGSSGGDPEESQAGGGSAQGGNGGSAQAGSGGSAQAGGDGGGSAGRGGSDSRGAGGIGGVGGSAGGSAGTGGQPPAEQCGTLDDALVIATTSIPEAFHSAPYDFSLTPLGGSHQGFAFDLQSGALPTGLALSSEGKLSGTPTQAGTFDFTIRLTDSAHAVSSQAFTLRVSAIKRWMALRDDQTLWLVDRLSPDAPKVPLTAKLETANNLEFSPDGSHLAYIVRYDETETEPLRHELYVVDVSGEKPSAPLLLGAAGTGVIPFQWSPDSQHLAFAVDSVLRSPPSDAIRCADVTTATGNVVDVEAGVYGTPQWLTAKTLGYRLWSLDKFKYATLGPQGFSAPAELSDFIYGWSFASAGDSIAYPTEGGLTWLDFASGATKHLDTVTSVSPGLHLQASNATDAKTWQLSRADAGRTPLVTWPETEKSGFAWSTESALVAVNSRVDVLRSSGEGLNRASICSGVADSVPGLAPGGSFSPDGSWLFFVRRTGSVSHLFAVGIVDGQALAPIEVMSEPSDLNLQYSVSPDSRWLVGWSLPTQAPRERPFLMRLSREGVGSPRTIALDDPHETSEKFVSWAPDSSRFGFSTHNGQGWKSYVVDVADSNAQAKPVGSGDAALFQP